MAVIYCRSTDGSDGDDGSTWALAKATLQAAVTAAGAGGTVWVSQVHDQNQTVATTIACGANPSNPVRILCGNDAAEPPTSLATTAVLKTTGNYALSINGYAYIYGLTLRAGVGTALAANLNIGSGAVNALTFDNCRLELATTSSTSYMSLGSSYKSYLTFINCQLKFAAAGHYILANYVPNILFKSNGSQYLVDSGGTLPTYLVKPQYGVITFDGLDLSNLTGTLAGVSTLGKMYFRNCKLNASVTVCASTMTGHGDTICIAENCDSGDTNNRFEYHSYPGVSIRATNCYLNATYSIKMTPRTGASYLLPLESPSIAQWNSSTGSSKTATIEIIHNEAADLNDDEIWMELEYLGTSGYPLALFVDDRKTLLGTAAAQTSSTAAWTEDLAGERKQKLSVTFTPQEAGYLVAKVYVGKVTTNPIYVDPYITVS